MKKNAKSATGTSNATPGADQPAGTISLKSDAEIALMRESGRITSMALDAAFDALEPGITTREVNAIAENVIRSHRAKPAFLNLYGFPATACISINEEIVHGIPSERKLKSGDLVSIDCGSIVGGYYSDTARTVQVPPAVEDERARLIAVCKEALERAIAQCVEGRRIGDISNAVESYVRSEKFELVTEYVGHGVGKSLHEPPSVPNVGPPGVGPKIIEGMTIAIEPMIMMGGPETELQDDNWTVSTADSSLSAHFEHTVAITRDGPEVLTA